ncbi:MAG: threonine--tRNA ligase [Patescibacteria group bacterium]|nr:threonine--tRNA ligase [Patescibacteria group bacterium]MDD5716078.1 threonine--tRNA ligase [Patescibacteria group bacterium]
MENQLEKIRHSLSHLLAHAVQDMFADVKFGIGPTIENGFYYDFELPRPLTPQDLPKIEKRMKNLIRQNIQFEKKELSPDQAHQQSKGQPYKLELIDELAREKKAISYYISGKFTDLCAGPHITTSKEIPIDAFKLTRIAGAYWRGDEKNKMLQRIYGVAFLTKADLDAYLKRQAEAEKRDHRRIGNELALFTFSELVGPGLPMYLPNGTILMRQIGTYLESLKTAQGYEPVDIPHLAKNELYKTSGHWDKFKDDIFHVKGKVDEFVLKPMNCPHHATMYASMPRSYRDLPVRYAEMTKMYRDEQTGELHGLSRVRSITIDDTHIFCRPDQILEECGRAYTIIKEFYRTFNFPLKVELSIRDPKHPEKYLGDDAIWKKAEDTLAHLLKTLKLNYTLHEGEAAFYGPKIDFKAQDSLGRTWQLSTIQLDFNLPERFQLEYTDEAGKKTRPVMVHIAVAGSMERFLSIIIEHYAGAFPTWLAPVQVAIITVGKAHGTPARKLHAKLKAAGIRTALYADNETVGYKIRTAEKLRIPYTLVIGDKEVKSSRLHVRIRGKKQLAVMATQKFITRITKEIQARK